MILEQSLPEKFSLFSLQRTQHKRPSISFGRGRFILGHASTCGR
jgi:hypothetical protein